MTDCDIVVVGAGIVGLAAARELGRRHPGARIEVLEREPAIGLHQTAHNSGVIHAGIYYKPGSLKAKLCVEGAAEMYGFCAENGVAHERCGKLIVARDESELPGLDELERRGRENGVPGLKRLDAAELREVEPHATGVAALHSPHTGIADFGGVAKALAAGLSVTTGAGVTGVAASGSGVELTHAKGRTRAGFAVFCAGGWSDRLAVMAGAPAEPRIVPFRGAYLRLKAEKRHLVRSLIYPVPDPSLPFLGVHLTKHTSGDILVGPTALLAPRRLGSTLSWPGSYRMFKRFWRTGLTEIRHAASRAAFVGAAAKYVPGLKRGDVEFAFAGYRAQALNRDGSLEDDFVVHETERAIHVRNAPSPAATSSLAIARLIADRAEGGLA